MNEHINQKNIYIHQLCSFKAKKNDKINLIDTIFHLQPSFMFILDDGVVFNGCSRVEH